MGKLIPDLSSATTVGLDLAKHVFQVHCVDASGCVVVAKAIRRKHLLEFFASLPRCLVGLEASGSAHHWARELITLGHEVRMMPPAYVKPYIRRQKNDAADAAATPPATCANDTRCSSAVHMHLPAKAARHAQCLDFHENESGTFGRTGQACCALQRSGATASLRKYRPFADGVTNGSNRP